MHRNKEEVERKLKRIAEELDKRDVEKKIGEVRTGKDTEKEKA